ncbi:MAG TPA: DNA invertase [Microbacteriaceae bacterium]|jgi:DNA invertase Pin-like site-specific DNA recombinase|nr:DNA invertase [Microbacteriaceae bacterium]
MTLLGYARISTSDGRQITDRQLDALTEAGCERIWTDQASGTKSSRPELDAHLAYAREGDTVCVLGLDRLGRDVGQLLAWSDELRERGVHLRILQLGVDTSTPAGKLLFTLVGAITEMEVEVLRQRVREGLAAAKLRGRVGGRPPSLTLAAKAQAVRMRGEGLMTAEIASVLGCSDRTLRRLFASRETTTVVVRKLTPSVASMEVEL